MLKAYLGEKKHLVMEKQTVNKCRDSLDLRVMFESLVGGLGTNFHNFRCLGIGMKSDDLHGYPRGPKVIWLGNTCQAALSNRLSNYRR